MGILKDTKYCLFCKNNTKRCRYWSNRDNVEWFNKNHNCINYKAKGVLLIFTSIIILFLLTGCNNILGSSQLNLVTEVGSIDLTKLKEVKIEKIVIDEKYFDYFMCNGEKVSIESTKTKYEELGKVGAGVLERDGCTWLGSAGGVPIIQEVQPILKDGEYTLIDGTATGTNTILIKEAGKDVKLIANKFNLNK